MFLLPIRDCRMCWLRKRPDFVMTRSIVRTVNFIVFLVSSASAGLIPLHDNHITLPDQLVARVGMYTPKDAADIASPIYVLWSSPTPKSMSYGIEAGSGSFLRLQAQFAVDQTVTGLQGGVSILVLRSDSASWFGLDAKSRTPDLELCCTAALLKAGRCNQLGHVLIRYSPPWGFDYRMGDPVEVFQPFNDDVRREGLDLADGSGSRVAISCRHQGHRSWRCLLLLHAGAQHRWESAADGVLLQAPDLGELCVPELAFALVILRSLRRAIKNLTLAKEAVKFSMYRRLLATLVVAWSLGAALVFAQLCVTAANASVPDYWTVEYWWNCALHFLNFVVVAVVAVLLRPISNTRHPAFDESYDMIVLDETTRHALICRNL
eukprot:TRINITY_DN5895_c0_g1_i4.p1 TRINITY_DN5895_c0_g1~~TRINITY_DN5895_c0_g1_i4.p1  ORF type:complete len:409 (+),score=-4.46 TRINITY_DN5895_c0_g1_i4:95-1228(+)